MKVETFTHIEGKGWSVKSFPELDSEQTLVLIFAAPELRLDPSPIKEISEYYSKSKIIGCSTSGEIAGSQINDRSLSVAVVRFESTKLKLVKSTITKPEDSFNVGEKIVTELKDQGLKGIFVLSNEVSVNGSELARGFNSVSNKDFVVTGGFGGDGYRFKETWIICQGEILTGAIVAVGFYGDNIEIGYAYGGGWEVFGPERYITHSKDNILYEVDGKPVLPFYKEYLGERAKDLPAAGVLFPLSIRKDEADTNRLVRTISSINEKDQSITFSGNMPKGYLTQLMHARFDQLISSAGEAAGAAANKISKTPNSNILSVAVSCAGRRLLLGEQTEEEIEALLKSLPEGTKQVGYYSYGELSTSTPGTCDLHNQTMTLTLFSEK